MFITTIKRRRLKFRIKNKLAFVLTMLFAAGLAYGSISFCFYNHETARILENIVYSFSAVRADQDILNTFFNSLFSNFIILILVYLLGFGALSQPISFIVPFFYGLGIGVSAGYMYKESVITGFLYTLSMIIPHAFIMLVAVILGVRESIKLSNLFLGTFIPKFHGELDINVVKKYNQKFLVLSVLAFISSVVDCIFTYLFIGLFI